MALTKAEINAFHPHVHCVLCNKLIDHIREQDAALMEARELMTAIWRLPIMPHREMSVVKRARAWLEKYGQPAV